MINPTQNPTITLQADPRGNYVTWKQGKLQIRQALKAIGWRAMGTFRPRKENKNEFSIRAKDPRGNMYWIKASRKPNATIEKMLITL